jgi:hypothetical protein
MEHIWHWILDFTGVNNGDNVFSTHMYNFWSGFGGNISVLALAGVLIGIYRHYRKQLKSLNPVNFVKKPLEIVHHHKEEDK